MSYRIIVQLFVFGISLLIAFMYIQPKFLVIQALQAEQAEYDLVIERATQFNSLLNTLLNKTNSLSQSDLQQLERYLPQTTDTAAVAKNIEAIAWKNNVTPNSIVISATESANTAEIRRVQAVDFEDESEEDAVSLMEQLETQEYSVSLTGSYAAFKNFLVMLESNRYPLQVQSLSVLPLESADPEVAVVEGRYTFALNIQTFSLANEN